MKTKYVKIENDYKEKSESDNNMGLEFTLKNRDEEVARLKTELNNINSMKEFFFAFY